MYNHWDDHEFLNDFAIDQTRYPTAVGHAGGPGPRIVTVDGRKLYADGVKAFREYMPVTYSKSRGIYRSFRWGKNLEVFFLDERSFRDAGADDNGTCDNPPGSGNRDLAPTAPQRIRTAFAAVVPQLASPPPPGCLERINDPSRDYLGAAQFNRFTQAVKRSKATFKVVMNELPIQQFYVDPYDRWEGYAAERQRLIEFLRDNVRNVVFLTADVHANLVNDVRLRTLEDGGPSTAGSSRSRRARRAPTRSRTTSRTTPATSRPATSRTTSSCASSRRTARASAARTSTCSPTARSA